MKYTKGMHVLFKCRVNSDQDYIHAQERTEFFRMDKTSEQIKQRAPQKNYHTDF